MADAKLTALTAASALAAADLFYVSQSAASRKATGTQLLALVGTAYVPLAGGTMTGALTLPAGTEGSPALVIGSGVGFYNTGGTVLDMSIAGAVAMRMSANGWYLPKSSGLIELSSGGSLGWDNGIAGTGTTDIRLYRDAAATLAQRNGTTQQIFRLYNTTDAGLTNYERLTLTGVAGTSVNITAETLGTGADNLDIVLTPAGSGTTIATGPLQAGSLVTGGGAANANGFTVSYYAPGIRMSSTCLLNWATTSPSSGADTGFARGAAGQVDVTNGTAATYRDLKLRNLIQTEYSQLTEMTAPSAPATNSVRIYAEDNGAGKTRLMALFATGAAQQIVIEP